MSGRGKVIRNSRDGGAGGRATHDRVDPAGGDGLVDGSVLGSLRLRWVEEAASEEAQAEAEAAKEMVQEAKAICGVDAEAGMRIVRAGREKRRHCWLWGAIDGESKLLMAVEVGERSLQTAQRVVHTVVSVLAPGIEPLFVSDQLAA